MSIDHTEIDTALLGVVAIAASPPAIVRPYFDPIDDARQWAKNFSAAHKKTEVRIDSWEREGRTSLAHLAEVIARVGNLDDVQLSRLISTAELMEAKGAEDMKEMANSFRQLSRLTRKMSKFSPQHAGVLSEAAQRLKASWQREIDIRMDAALFFRALKAEYDPEARGGKSFEDSGSLEKYLNNLAA